MKCLTEKLQNVWELALGLCETIVDDLFPKQQHAPQPVPVEEPCQASKKTKAEIEALKAKEKEELGIFEIEENQSQKPEDLQKLKLSDDMVFHKKSDAELKQAEQNDIARARQLARQLIEQQRGAAQ